MPQEEEEEKGDEGEGGEGEEEAPGIKHPHEPFSIGLLSMAKKQQFQNICRPGEHR